MVLLLFLASTPLLRKQCLLPDSEVRPLYVLFHNRRRTIPKGSKTATMVANNTGLLDGDVL
jgi:hypothetical protein